MLEKVLEEKKEIYEDLKNKVLNKFGVMGFYLVVAFIVSLGETNLLWNIYGRPDVMLTTITLNPIDGQLFCFLTSLYTCGWVPLVLAIRSAIGGFKARKKMLKAQKEVDVIQEELKDSKEIERDFNKERRELLELQLKALQEYIKHRNRYNYQIKRGIKDLNSEELSLVRRLKLEEEKKNY